MLVLTILDGWGYAPPGPGNAIALARKPVYDRMLRQYPNTLIQTSGPFVGLPEGQMGNSEVGHLNIGAGRVVSMDITRLDKAIADGSFFHSPELLAAMHHARQGRQLHLLGLCSDGGVHSHVNHLYALLRMAKAEGVERVFLHAFTDGRDTAPHSGRAYLEQIEQKMREYGVGAIATVSGRYYAMDRDLRWPRVQLAESAMTHGAGPRAASASDVLRDSYEKSVTDEFVIPTVITGKGGEPVATIRDGDAVIFFNYRADRARQMTRALTRTGAPSPELEAAIPASSVPKDLHYVCLTRYDPTFTLPIVLPPQPLDHILAQILGEHGLRNLRVAETEKYAHVTYFFNGGIEKAFPGEERSMVASPKVATYDLKPEMSAAGVAETVVQAIEKSSFDLVVVNFANADMVGHSGQIAPTIKAVETVDACLGQIEAALRRKGGAMLITADHGNAEMMIDPATGGPHTYHTTNPVPFILLGERAAGREVRLRTDGSLRDIAPTVLGILDVAAPPDMTGRDLRI